MPLYKNMPWNLNTSLFCLIASFVDAAIILIIYFIVTLLLQDSYWILELKLKSILLSLFIGFILSVIAEKIAITNNMWSYSNIMPLLLNWNVGISPILQMLILPLIVFKLTQLKILKLLSS